MSRAQAADKSERGSGSSSEVATAPPGPTREQDRDKALPPIISETVKLLHLILNSI